MISIENGMTPHFPPLECRPYLLFMTTMMCCINQSCFHATRPEKSNSAFCPLATSITSSTSRRQYLHLFAEANDDAFWNITGTHEANDDAF
mmetsp:Transcript_19602/g.29086  ORF Transcript_19602/g.29086 Transcript_19602/m.29086 type:complete len:91 (+) Transcript_19602:3842-4114(+)